MHIWPQDGMSDTSPRPRPIIDDYQEAAASIGVELLMRRPKVGELYIAGRNTGLKLLTAKEIDDRGWIVPDDLTAYPFDSNECIAVKETVTKH